MIIKSLNHQQGYPMCWREALAMAAITLLFILFIAYQCKEVASV